MQVTRTPAIGQYFWASVRIWRRFRRDLPGARAAITPRPRTQEQVTNKITLRVRFELTRCDAPLVFMSKISDLKTSAVGRLATSAHLHSIMSMPFKPSDVRYASYFSVSIPSSTISIILIFISSLLVAYADQRRLASAVLRSP